MPLYTDQTGKTFTLTEPPVRIVSLVPSQTELLYGLGLDEQVVGITTFCVHPTHWHRTKTRIGGTKAVHTGQVHALRPDLIIANKEENLKATVDELALFFPVYTSDISNLPAALQMITDIGSLTHTSANAMDITRSITTLFQQLQSPPQPVRAAYLIWQEPFMTVGSDTFIHDMMTRAGFDNIFSDVFRYPITSIAEIRERNCEVLLLSSEPFPFKEKHRATLQQQLPSTRILLTDGELFSWYGSRLLLAPPYFNTLAVQARQ